MKASICSRYIRRRSSGAGPGKFAFSPDANLTEESEFLTPENKIKLAQEWFPFFDLRKRFLLEKSPPNILVDPISAERFPELLDSASLTASGRRFAGHGKVESYRAGFTGGTLAGGARDVREGPPHLRRVMSIKYEKLISQPFETISTIYKFLGLDTHPTTFEATSEHNKKYFAQWNALKKIRSRALPSRSASRSSSPACARSDTAWKTWICCKRHVGQTRADRGRPSFFVVCRVRDFGQTTQNDRLPTRLSSYRAGGVYRFGICQPRYE